MLALCPDLLFVSNFPVLFKDDKLICTFFNVFYSYCYLVICIHYLYDIQCVLG